MKRSAPCERELESVRAGRLGAPSEHVRACEACQEAVRMATWMQMFASLPDEPHALPDASRLWWKGQLVQRWEAERKAAAPLDTMHRVEPLVGAVGLSMLAWWYWPAVSRWLSLADTYALAVAGPISGVSVTPVLVLAVVLLALTAIVAVHAMLRIEAKNEITENVERRT